MRYLRPVVLACTLLLTTLARAGDQDSDRWYELWLAGSRSGWSHEVVTTEGDRITTRSDMEMTIGRADQSTTIRTSTVFIETTDGAPVEVTVSQTLGQAPIEARYVFREDDVLAITGTGPGAREQPMPKPAGEWLAPAAASRFLAQRLASGAEAVTVRTIDPSSGLTIIEVERTGIAKAELEVLGRTTECFQATSETAMGPVKIKATEWIDADGNVLRSETAMGAMTITMVASTRENAMESADPAEVMISTFVRPSRPISYPRRSTRGVYTVRLTEGEMPALPASAYQSVEPAGDGAARVTVDLGRPIAAGEVDRAEYLASTSYADTGDELLRELTAKATEGAGDDPAARAEALRRFVFAHITDKNLGTAFATASETARSCRGDCSEHGVLLAAMLRTAGIPSRVAVGVVYVDRFAGERDVFGYHMWAQGLLETENGPAWVDLDATLNERAPFDAAHIAFGTSSLGETDAITSLAGIAPLLGALEIKVEEVK
ncbi:MAG: transglutaminase domain-containing protein [Phycisphaerales bacterium]|nr:transglutaminase domain-containing protein [Phycisphaerales bacterium]